MLRPVEVVRHLCPRPLAAYAEAFERGDPAFAAAGVTTPLRLAHFLAQVFHESGDLTIARESGAYTAQNLADMWDGGNWRKYFASRGAMIAMAAQCRIDHGEELFSIVYGDRMGNGPPSTRDGWIYRGNGLMQTTGRWAHRAYGLRCGADFENRPELLTTAEWALAPALAEWSYRGCNEAADRDDIYTITRIINGGTIGLGRRKAEYEAIRPYLLGDRDARADAVWQVVAGADAPARWQVTQGSQTILDLQIALNKLGAALAEDGRAGPATKAATRAFQAAHGLVADGIAGVKTWAALRAA